jgi:hypothetical protein
MFLFPNFLMKKPRPRLLASARDGAKEYFYERFTPWRGGAQCRNYFGSL